MLERCTNHHWISTKLQTPGKKGDPKIRRKITTQETYPQTFVLLIVHWMENISHGIDFCWPQQALHAFLSSSSFLFLETQILVCKLAQTQCQKQRVRTYERHHCIEVIVLNFEIGSVSAIILWLRCNKAFHWLKAMRSPAWLPRKVQASVNQEHARSKSRRPSLPLCNLFVLQSAIEYWILYERCSNKCRCHMMLKYTFLDYWSF